MITSITSGSYKRSTTWQKHRRLEAEVKTTWNNSLRAGYEYGTDLEGRRASEDVTGPIATKFDSSYTYGFQMTWTYTERGEVDVNNSEKLDSSGDPIEDSIYLWDRNWSNRKGSGFVDCS